MSRDEPHELPRRLRAAAYAVIIRARPDGESEILLSRLAPYLVSQEMWTLPGGGIEFGEHPRDAVVREVYEETGLSATVGELAWVDSGQRVTADPTIAPTLLHSVRMVFAGWVPVNSPAPRVVEVDGSTVDARWHSISALRAGVVPTVPMVRGALAVYAPARVQRTAAYALIRRDDSILLTRVSSTGHHPGAWTLPGGGIDHGESPADAVRRELTEEAGLEATVGALLGTHDVHFTGTAPSGRTEDFHGIHLVFAATVDPDTEPAVQESDGTTDAVAWVSIAAIRAGELPVLDVVMAALAWTA